MLFNAPPRLLTSLGLLLLLEEFFFLRKGIFLEVELCSLESGFLPFVFVFISIDHTLVPSPSTLFKFEENEAVSSWEIKLKEFQQILA